MSEPVTTPHIERWWEIHHAVDVVKFKKCILLMDLQSRRFLLERCLAYIETQLTEGDAGANVLHKWFKQCSILSEADNPIENKLRKDEISSPDFWKPIFDLYMHPILMKITKHVLALC